jgi:DNA-directed RNA polymerase specialized sigma24 family protein
MPIDELTDKRTERLLALILLAQMKGASQKEKVHALSLAGFQNIEIANILETTADKVKKSLYQARQPRRRERPN